MIYVGGCCITSHIKKLTRLEPAAPVDTLAPGSPMPAGTLTALAVISALVVGFGAGWGLRPVPDASQAIEAQTVAIKAMQDGQTELAATLSRPVVIDAEIRSQLSDIPIQCRKDAGGEPLGVACLWASCLQFGQSNSQRPECSAVRDLLIDTMRGEACAD